MFENLLGKSATASLEKSQEVIASGKQDLALAKLIEERDLAISRAKSDRASASRLNDEAHEFEKLAADYQTAIDKLRSL